MIEPSDDMIRKALHDMIDVLEPTQLHAIYLINANLFLHWNRPLTSFEVTNEEHKVLSRS
jgi:hypothetical protein